MILQNLANLIESGHIRDAHDDNDDLFQDPNERE